MTIKKRVMFFIDGSNHYHIIKDMFNNKKKPVNFDFEKFVKDIVLLDKSSIFPLAKKFTKNKTEKINLFKYFDSQNIKIIEVSKEEGILLSTNIFNIGNKKLISYKHNNRINNLERKTALKY